MRERELSKRQGKHNRRYMEKQGEKNMNRIKNNAGEYGAGNKCIQREGGAAIKST